MKLDTILARDFNQECRKPQAAVLSKTDEEIIALKHRFMDIARAQCPDFRVRADQRSVIRDIFRWCVMIPGNLNPDKGLWLWGNIGTGKSTMLKIIRRFCRDVRPPKADGFPYSFRISNADEVCGHFVSTGYDGIETYLQSPAQAFDELGSEPPLTAHYGTPVNVFQYILQRRYDNRYMAFTHVTTNLRADEISDRYGERIYDRCKEMFNFVQLSGKTFRKP